MFRSGKMGQPNSTLPNLTGRDDTNLRRKTNIYKSKEQKCFIRWFRLRSDYSYYVCTANVSPGATLSLSGIIWFSFLIRFPSSFLKCKFFRRHGFVESSLIFTLPKPHPPALRPASPTLPPSRIRKREGRNFGSPPDWRQNALSVSRCLHPLQLHRAAPNTAETRTYYPGCQTRRVQLDAFCPALLHRYSASHSGGAVTFACAVVFNVATTGCCGENLRKSDGSVCGTNGNAGNNI